MKYLSYEFIWILYGFKSNYPLSLWNSSYFVFIILDNGHEAKQSVMGIFFSLYLVVIETTPIGIAYGDLEENVTSFTWFSFIFLVFYVT